MSNRTLIKFMLAIVCCAVIVLTPASRAYAQLGGAIKQGVEKGVDATKQGTQDAIDKTKEGAQDVGQGVKKAVTGEDDDKNTDRYKSSETTTTTTTTQQSKQSRAARKEAGAKSRMPQNGDNDLPKTAGELPLLLVISLACFAMVGTSKLARKRS